MVLRSMRAVLRAHDRFRNRGAGHGALEHAHSTNRRLVLVNGLGVVREPFWRHSTRWQLARPKATPCLIRPADTPGSTGALGERNLRSCRLDRRFACTR